MAGGRPTIFTEDLANTICIRLAGGESLRSICEDEAMPSKSTVLLWIVDGKHLEFSDQYTKAREAQAHGNVDEMLDMREGLLSGDIDANAARVVVDIIKWSSERMARKKYGKDVVDDDSTQKAQSLNVTFEVREPVTDVKVTNAKSE